ncbi:hypothetical protein [Planctomicrobium sp. SH664]|uniref:hypothetical protein n=1 Tax=Planctomicrobium sp. SH664 TaxID=3448125 RepID=UPI003F5BBE1C
MTAGLDLGSSEFRSLRRQDHRLIARRIPAVYTIVDDNPAQRRLLEQSHINYSVTNGSLVVMGEAAHEISRLLSRPIIPVLPNGELPTQDPVTRQVCAWMIDSLLPSTSSAGAPCCLVLPKGETPKSGSLSATGRFLQHIVELRGYQTEIQHPATALTLAELEEQEFTGIGLTIGAESVTLAVAHLSQPILECRNVRGSHDVLERFAHIRRKYLWDQTGNAYVDFAGLQSWLRSGEISLSSPTQPDEVWLANSYEEMLLAAFTSMKRKIAGCSHPICREPLPMVISGGACRLTGFLELVAEAIRLIGLPLQIHDLRTATFDPYSVARGLLIKATLIAGEEPVLHNSMAAAG